MTASSVQAARAGSQTAIQRAIEAGWLLAAVLVPLGIAPEDYMLGFIQMPKVFALRTLVLYLVVAVTIEWALRPQPAMRADGPLLSRLRGVLVQHPARSVVVGAGAVLLATLVSVAFAPVKAIAIWGIDPGWDTYGLVSLAAYLVIFGVVATHLRTAVQLRRLVWALTGASMLIGLVSVGQHFGLNPLRTNPEPLSRARSTFGNPIFAGSYLVMTVPLTLALFMSYRSRMSPLANVWIGFGLIALQLTALVFGLSRGSWIAMGAGAVAFLALLAWVRGWRELARPLAILWLAAAFAVVMLVPPVPGSTGTVEQVTERLGSIVPAIGGGLNYRLTIWTTAAEVFLTVPWVDTDLFPEIPALGFRALRRLVGYGPDMFGYAYPLARESTYTFELASQGHNFVVHTALELGLLGVAGYLGLLGALGMVLFRMLRTARAGAYPEWFTLLLVGLGAALTGRVIEQIPGKAQISDLALSWMLAGVIVAMSTMRFDRGEAPVAPPRRARRVRRLQAAPFNPLRVVAAAVGALLILAFWVQGVLVYPFSARVAAQAKDAAAAGETQRAIDLYTAARDIAPDLPVNRLQRSELLFNSVGQVAEAERPALVRSAYEEMAAVLDRNPLDHRARARAGEYLRELSVMTDDIPHAEAARDSEVLVQLMPGFWQSHAALAWSYVRLGRYEEGLGTVATAKALSATANPRPDTHLLHFVEAVALRNLGRLDESLLAAQRSINERPNAPAQELIEQLTRGGDGP